MAEKIGQYFFKEIKGKFVAAPNPLEMINGKLTSKILRVGRNEKFLQGNVQYTVEDWDQDWKRCAENPNLNHHG